MPSACIAIPEPASAAGSEAASSAAARTRRTVSPIGLGPRLVHVQGPAAHIRTVQRGDRTLRFPFVRHLHKRKTARPAGLSIGHEAHALHRSIILEEGSNRLLTDTKIEVTYKNIFQVFSLTI